MVYENKGHESVFVMAAFALGMIARRLWRTLRPHLVAIGRWVIDRVRQTSGPRIYHYMLERSSYLWDKAKRARKLTVRSRLRRRSRAWARAARWILRHLPDLDLSRVVGELCEAARNAKIPLCSRSEST